MKQRLGLAAALLRPRELLVLDEPTNGLDPQGMREIRSLVRGLAADGTYWHVDDVEATVRQLLAVGAREKDAPFHFGAGFVAASVVDPFGNVLGVMYNPHYVDVLRAS